MSSYLKGSRAANPGLGLSQGSMPPFRLTFVAFGYAFITIRFTFPAFGAFSSTFGAFFSTFYCTTINRDFIFINYRTFL